MIMLSRFGTRTYALLVVLIAFLALAPQGAAFAAGSATHLKGNSHQATSPRMALTPTCVSDPSITYCDNVDPYSGGCVNSGTQNAAQVTIPGTMGYSAITVYLRYTPSCHAGWAKLTAYSSTPMGGWVERYYDGKISEYIIPPGTNMYTNMLYGPAPFGIEGELRACGFYNIGGQYATCTAWVVVV